MFVEVFHQGKLSEVELLGQKVNKNVDLLDIMKFPITEVVIILHSH